MKRNALLLALVAALCAVAFWYGTRITDRPSEVDATPEPAWFENVAASSGMDSEFVNGDSAKLFTILESLGGGAALLDYDGDGRLDVFLPGGGYFEGVPLARIRGRTCRLYRNLGDWRFRDVTDEAGLALGDWYTHGAAVADFDRDGDPDLAITGYGRLGLYRNDAMPDGSRRFRDVTTELGLDDRLWSTSAGWADVDGDGFPDLYVCHYCDWSPGNNPPCPGIKPGVTNDVCPPERFKPQIHALFKNEGGTRFRNTASEQGFAARGNGLGVVLADMNDDGRPDIYAANDATANFLYLNRGGRLEEVGLRAGVALDARGRPNGSMGTTLADFDGSGRPALFVSNFQKELLALYRNDGGERFSHASEERGLAELPDDTVGFGLVALDADNDGWDDLLAANGHVVYQPPYDGRLKQTPLLLLNADRGGRRGYRDISGQAGPFFQIPRLGRGLAAGDLDDDGAADAVMNHSDGPVALLRNRRANSNWIGFRLKGRGHRDVVGSTLIVEAGGRRFTRFAKGGGSYLAASDPRLLVGLGAASNVDRVSVKWSWGETRTWTNLTPGRYWDLNEDAK